MRKFILVNAIITASDKLVPAGTVVDLEEDAASTKGYLNRGSIKPYDSDSEQENGGQPSPEQIQAELDAANV